MYNEERKLQYIEYKMDTATLDKYFLKNIFGKAETFEEAYGKDMAEWNAEQIISFYKWYDTCSLYSLMNINSALHTYCLWCLKNGYVSSDCYKDVTYEMLGECVNKEELSKIFVTRKQLVKMLEDLVNPVDKFLLLALFEGIKGDYCSEITHLKTTDIDGRYIILPTRRIVISDMLRELCYRSAEEVEYLPFYREDLVTYLDNSDETLIFKQNKKRVYYDDRHMDRCVTGRYKVISKYLGFPEKLTSKKLIISGKLEFIKGLCREEGKRVEDIITEKRELINNQYTTEKIKSAREFMEKYGAILDE